MKKRILALVLCLALLGAAPAYAADGKTAAETLYGLGLFQGAAENPDGSPDFALGRAATRTEALVMLIRLLGREAEAKSYTGAQPFTDVPNWARGYVAYAYASGLTDGVSETLFGAQQTATANMYLTFVLRALGYDDKAASPDFRYAEAAAFAGELGLTEGVDTQGFLRGDVAAVSLAALSQPLKGAEATLVQSLVDAFAVDPAAARAAGFDVREAEAKTVAILSVEADEFGTREVLTSDLLAAFPSAHRLIDPAIDKSTSEELGQLRGEDPAVCLLRDALFYSHFLMMNDSDVQAHESHYFSSRMSCFLLDDRNRVIGYCITGDEGDDPDTVVFTRCCIDTGALLAELEDGLAKSMATMNTYEITVDWNSPYDRTEQGAAFYPVYLNGEPMSADYACCYGYYVVGTPDELTEEDLLHEAYQIKYVPSIITYADGTMESYYLELLNDPRLVTLPSGQVCNTISFFPDWSVTNYLLVFDRELNIYGWKLIPATT